MKREGERVALPQTPSCENFTPRSPTDKEREIYIPSTIPSPPLKVEPKPFIGPYPRNPNLVIIGFLKTNFENNTFLLPLILNGLIGDKHLIKSS